MRWEGVKTIIKASRPVPYACPQPYHPAVAAMDSCFGLVRPHQHGIAVRQKYGDMAVRIRKVLARPWVGVGVCHSYLFCYINLLSAPIGN